MNKIVSNVKRFVEEECKKPTSKYGYEPFPFHFVPMVKYAKKLTAKLGGDKEIIEVAGWLHDIGSIIQGRENHHLSGAKIAGNFLQKLNYPENKIAKVQNCIRHHRGSKNFRRQSIEEKIIAEADAMSNFDNISGMFKAAFIYENLSQGDAQKSVLRKLENKWGKLHFSESKKMLRPKYNAIMLLLK